MAGDERRQLSRDPACLESDGRLDVRIGRNVDDEPARRAREVVVVLPAERLAQLEPIVVTSAGHPLQHADSLEHDEVAVQRAL